MSCPTAIVKSYFDKSSPIDSSPYPKVSINSSTTSIFFSVLFITFVVLAIVVVPVDSILYPFSSNLFFVFLNTSSSPDAFNNCIFILTFC